MDLVYYRLNTILCLLILNAEMLVVTRTREAEECTGSEYFLCNTGECLAKHQLCDSFIDCADISDETAAVCLAHNKGRCPRGQWRCAYGACLNDSLRCDQRPDCWDESDEEDCPYLSTTTELQTSTAQASDNPCEVPMSNNTLFYTWSSQHIRIEPGKSVEHNDLLLFSCDSDHHLGVEGGTRTFTVCKNGQWSPKIPKCTTVVECTSDNNCAAQLICSSQRCVDPCPISCGLNTSCIVKDHRASCSCKPGLVGDPFERCIDPKERVKMYQFYEDKVTWLEALEDCRRHDMQLVSVESVEEQEHLVELLKLNDTEVQNMWTSGAEIGGDFIWVSTGFGLDYTNWQPGEPSSHRISRPIQKDEIEGCIEIAGIWDYHWNDVGCSRRNAYICEA